MPPKKLSKKELERKKREEEERKRQEEEEERIRAEQEEKERIQREKLEAEERKKLEKQELKQRSVELDEFRVMLSSVEGKLAEDVRITREKYSWDRYLRCDGSPDPSIPQEINTYMNLWREDDRIVEIEPVMEEALQCLRLIEELEYLSDEYRDDSDFQKQLEQFDQTMSELQVLLQQKIDRTSLEMLSQASIIKDRDENNLSKSWQFQSMVLCLWGNISKKVKFAEFKFPEIGLVAGVVPKALSQSDVAFRLLHTRFDHYSNLCRYSRPRPKAAPEILAKVELDPVSEYNAQPSQEHELNEEKHTEHSDLEKGDDANDDEVEGDVMLNLMDELNKAGDIDNEEKEETVQEQEEEIDPPQEDFEEEPVVQEWEDHDGEECVVDLRSWAPLGGLLHVNMVQLPPQPRSGRGWTMTHQVVPARLTPLDYVVIPASTAPTVPPNEEQTQRTSDRKANSAQTGGRLTSADHDRDTIGAHKGAEAGPFLVKLRLPETLVVAEAPTLAIWNEETYEWQTGFVHVTDYKEPERLLSFEMERFGVLGLFQDIHINMPFQSWSLRPYRLPTATVTTTVVKSSTKSIVGNIDDSQHHEAVLPDHSEFENPGDHSDKDNYHFNQPSAADVDISSNISASTDSESPFQCLLTLTAAIFQVKLHVRDDKVQIVSDAEHPELNSIAGVWHSVSSLIKTMREAGINIFPQQDSHKYLNTVQKNLVAERRLYEQIALLSPSMAFGHSRWNAECKNKDSIIVLACEHLQHERAVNEEDWNVLCYTRKKVEKLKMSEFDEKFSTEKDDKYEFHSNLFHFIRDVGSEEAMLPINNIDVHYYDIVRKLLKAIRPVVFT